MWRPANNGNGARIWFVAQGDGVTTELRYHTNKRDDLIRYATYEAALRVAERLNRTSVEG